MLENPAWYTAYTPYQAEISQGRMEALINFQTMVCELTGMAIAGSSMLDEATAAAEAMTLALRVSKSKSTTLFIADDVLPQTLEVIRTRAKPIGVSGRGRARLNRRAMWMAFAGVAAIPRASDGVVRDLEHPSSMRCMPAAALAIVAADLLALVLLTSPGEMGADIVVGTTQRFGMPMGNGGPHAAYLATKDEFKRSMPGRLVGVSIDAHGAPAYRLALQTREHDRDARLRPLGWGLDAGHGEKPASSGCRWNRGSQNRGGRTTTVPAPIPAVNRRCPCCP